MSLQERLETIRLSPAPQNEESAKFQILAPILQSLGWDPYGPEVLYELSVGGKGSGGRADIALKSSGRVVALIEAKAPGADLRSHVGQVLGYAFHEGVDICVLTTGLEWWLYLPRESGPPSERRFAVLKIREDPVEQLLEDFNAFLSRETLVNGQAERRAKAVRKAGLEAAQLNKEIPSIWTQMLKEPDEELIELLSKRVYDKVNLRPTKPQVVAALQGSPIPSATASASSGRPPPASVAPVADPSSQWWDSWGKPTAIMLWGQRHSVSTHVGTYRKFLDLLHDRHPDDFDRALEVSLPNRRVLHVARDPKELGPRGEREHHEPRQSGIFFTEHSHPEAIEEIASALLEHFGHSAPDFEVRYD